MVIDVKATKATPEADPAERYLLKSIDSKSKAPFIVGAFLAGVFVYIKSMFIADGANPVDGATPAVPEDAGQDRSGATNHRLQVVSVNDDIDALGSRPEAATGANGQPNYSFRSGATAIDLADDTPFDFFKGNSRANALAVSPVIPMPSNDNLPASSSHAALPAVSGGTEAGAAADGDDGDVDESDDDDADVNRAPRTTGPVYLRDLVGCGVMLIALSDLLRNVEDPDGDALSISQISVSAGTLTSSGAEWIYSGGDLGPVTVTYRVTDGQYSVLQTAHFSVVPQPPIYGDDGDNIILGSMCADDIAAQGGNDNIDARDGNDTVDGGAGDDHILGGQGDDVIYGRGGNDIIFGGAGHDYISGGAGDDRLFGEDGDDIIFGDAGTDRLLGGDGNDLLFGGDGDDTLHDGHGSDAAHGGDGNDVVVAALDGAADYFDGGSGSDTISYENATQGLTIDLNKGAAAGIEIGDDTIAGFENVVGGQGDDVFIVGDEPVVLAGNGGSDEFVFGNDDAVQESRVVIHEIIDFKPGDFVRMSNWRIFEEVFDEAERQLEDVYGDRVDEDDAVIRYRRDEHNSIDRTIIEADLNNDDVFEITITLHGNHALLIVEHP